MTNRKLPDNPILFGIEMSAILRSQAKTDNEARMLPMASDDPDEGYWGDSLKWDTTAHRYVYPDRGSMPVSEWCDQDCVNDDSMSWGPKHNSDK